MSIDKKNLGKQKYIFRIYASEDKVIHCEKHPVIYLNSEVVYFKDTRKKEYLNNTKFNNVKDEYLGITSKDLSLYGWYDNYFWKVENFDSKKATEDAFEQKRKTELERAKCDFERAEKEYLSKKASYEKLQTN